MALRGHTAVYVGQHVTTTSRRDNRVERDLVLGDDLSCVALGTEVADETRASARIPQLPLRMLALAASAEGSPRWRR